MNLHFLYLLNVHENFEHDQIEPILHNYRYQVSDL